MDTVGTSNRFRAGDPDPEREECESQWRGATSGGLDALGDVVHCLAPYLWTDQADMKMRALLGPWGDTM